MAEIKSTMDLVMERTAGMTLSDDEKASLAKGEAVKRARGLLGRFEDSGWSADVFERLLLNEPENERDKVREVALGLFVEGLEPDAELGERLRVLARVFGLDDALVDDLADVHYRLQRAEAGAEEAARAAILADLAARGVSGSALIPKVTEESLIDAGSKDSDLIARFEAAKARILDTIHNSP